MEKQQRQRFVKHKFEFLKTTAIGGIFFLLPLAIVGTFLVKFAQYSLVAAKATESVVPIQSIGGYPMLLCIGAAILVGACFGAGLIAKRSIAKRFTETIEKQIQIAFPRYAIIKDRISGNIGGDHFRSELKSALILGVDGNYRFGVIVEQSDSGWTTVYLPGSPDPWAGEVVIVPSDRVRNTDCDFIQVMNTLEKLGRGLQATAQFDHATKVTLP